MLCITYCPRRVINILYIILILHKAVQPYTAPYSPTQPYTTLYNPTQPYTTLYDLPPPIQNLLTINAGSLFTWVDWVPTRNPSRWRRLLAARKLEISLENIRIFSRGGWFWCCDEGKTTKQGIMKTYTTYN